MLPTPPPADDAPPHRPASDRAPERTRERIRHLPWFIAIVAILGGSGLFLSGFALGAQRASTPGTPASRPGRLPAVLGHVQLDRERLRPRPVSRQTLVEGAIKGMIDALGDPFSQYLSPNDFQSTLEGLAGTFSGIGAVDPGHVDHGQRGLHGARAQPAPSSCRA